MWEECSGLQVSKSHIPQSFWQWGGVWGKRGWQTTGWGLGVCSEWNWSKKKKKNHLGSRLSLLFTYCSSQLKTLEMVDCSFFGNGKLWFSFLHFGALGSMPCGQAAVFLLKGPDISNVSDPQRDQSWE